jgi:hypothetical protein
MSALFPFALGASSPFASLTPLPVALTLPLNHSYTVLSSGDSDSNFINSARDGARLANTSISLPISSCDPLDIMVLICASSRGCEYMLFLVLWVDGLCDLGLIVVIVDTSRGSSVVVALSPAPPTTNLDLYWVIIAVFILVAIATTHANNINATNAITIMYIGVDIFIFLPTVLLIY